MPIPPPVSNGTHPVSNKTHPKWYLAPRRMQPAPPGRRADGELSSAPVSADPRHEAAAAPVPAPGDAALEELWRATDRLLERATAPGVLSHKLGPLAAVRLRRLGQPIPEAFRPEERAALLGMRTGHALVERIRASCDGPLVLLKGPEVASVYPSHARRFSDIDILAQDAEVVHRSLLANGFVDAPDDRGVPDEHHHLDPVRWPTISLKVEVHATPNWLPSMRPPHLDEILEAAVPSTVGVDGVDAPSALHHTLILASHAWREEPLQTLRDLVDIAALAAPLDRSELDRTAAAWGMTRVWRTSWRAIEGVFHGGASTFPLRTWARHLAEVRERSVFEHHLTRWLSPYWELPPLPALSRMTQVVRRELGPAPGETWGDKVGRARRALRNPHVPVSRHHPERPRQAGGNEDAGA